MQVTVSVIVSEPSFTLLLRNKKMNASTDVVMQNLQMGPSPLLHQWKRAMRIMRTHISTC